MGCCPCQACSQKDDRIQKGCCCCCCWQEGSRFIQACCCREEAKGQEGQEAKGKEASQEASCQKNPLPRSLLPRRLPRNQLPRRPQRNKFIITDILKKTTGLFQGQQSVQKALDILNGKTLSSCHEQCK